MSLVFIVVGFYNHIAFASGDDHLPPIDAVAIG